MPFLASQVVIFFSVALGLLIINYLHSLTLGLVTSMIIMIGGFRYLSNGSGEEGGDGDSTIGDAGDGQEEL